MIACEQDRVQKLGGDALAARFVRYPDAADTTQQSEET